MDLNLECLTFLSGLPEQGLATLPKQKMAMKYVQVHLHTQVQNNLVFITHVSSAAFSPHK